MINYLCNLEYIILAWRQAGHTKFGLAASILSNGLYITDTEIQANNLKLLTPHANISSLNNLQKFRGVQKQPLFFDTTVVSRLIKEIQILQNENADLKDKMNKV